MARVTTPGGAVAQFNSHGQVTSIRMPGMTIQHGAGGQRTIVSLKKDAAGHVYSVVSTGVHSGFVERSFAVNGQTYLRKTYVANGQAVTRVYGGYSYRGIMYYYYMPFFYYMPGFYDWMDSPWGPGAAYGWGWGPWYPTYGYYFGAYPQYPNAAMWLSDYVVATNLEAAYQGRGPEQAALANNTSKPLMTPDVKQAIADEVSAQLTEERQAAAQLPAAGTMARPGGASAANPATERMPAALDPKHRVFIVVMPLTEEAADGSQCLLRPGDVLERLDDSPDAHNRVTAMVWTSLKDDCRPGAKLNVSVKSLQEMDNQFRAQVDAGVAKLAASQGKDGIPSGPAANPREVAAVKTQPDTTAIKELQQQELQAAQAEKEVAQATKPGPSN